MGGRDDDGMAGEADRVLRVRDRNRHKMKRREPNTRVKRARLSRENEAAEVAEKPVW